MDSSSTSDGEVVVLPDDIPLFPLELSLWLNGVSAFLAVSRNAEPPVPRLVGSDFWWCCRTASAAMGRK